MTKNETRNKIFKAIDYIGNSHYVSNDNVKIGDKSCNDHVLLSFVTAMVNGKQLIQGSYGQGKTTTCEAVGSVYFSLPIEYFSESLLRCNPQKTEEKIYGRPDLGELSKGNEKVIWTNFSLSLDKILDEFNRLTKDKQTTILDQIDRGVINYLNEYFKLKTPIYATINQLDGGNSELLPPILDRFAITTLVTPPVGLTKYINGNKELLSDYKINQKIRRVLYDKELSALEKIEEVKGLSGDFYNNHEQNFLFTQEEREYISKSIEKVNMGGSAENFIDYFFAEVNYDPENGFKGDVKDPAKNHYKDNISKHFKEQLSVRWANNHVKSYSKCLSWLKGEEEVGLKTLKFLLPYTIIHRVNENYVDGNPLAPNKLRNAISIVDTVFENFKSDSGMIDNFFETMATQNIKSIDAWNESDHPYFQYYKQLCLDTFCDNFREV